MGKMDAYSFTQACQNLMYYTWGLHGSHHQTNTQITGSCNVVKKDIYQAQYFLVESTFSSILLSLDAYTVSYKETENH